MNEEKLALIRSCFASVVGQESAVELLQTAAMCFANGGLITNPSILGEAGLGKTTLCLAYAAAMKVAYGIKTNNTEVATVLSYKSPADFRDSDSDAWTRLRKAIRQERPLILHLDELAEFKDQPTNQTRAVFKFSKDYMDETGYSSNGVKVYDFLGESIGLDRSQICIIGATNFPDKVPDSAAMLSRFTGITLRHYDYEEIKQILILILRSKSITANDITMGILARTGRGTARPLEKICSYLVTQNKGSGKATNTINREEVVNAMKVLDYYPRGISFNELAILVRCASAVNTKTQLKLMLGLEDKTLSRAIAYLGGELHYLDGHGAKLTATKKGIEYLTAIKKDGFKLPA